MAEKTGYTGGYDEYDDYDDALDIDVDHQENHQENHQTEFALDSDMDFSGMDDPTDAAAVHEQVGHQLDHAVDDTIRADYGEKFGWRKDGRNSREGQFVPPDMRSYRGPVFVRVADLQNQVEVRVRTKVVSRSARKKQGP